MTIFKRIIAGEIPCFKVWESERHLAFLDIRPVAPGHTLVIPKKEVDPLFSMEDSEYADLLLSAKKVSEILKKAFLSERICMAVVGFEVPHAHIHLIPARSMSDFPWPGGNQATPKELETHLQKIKDVTP